MTDTWRYTPSWASLQERLRILPMLNIPIDEEDWYFCIEENAYCCHFLICWQSSPDTKKLGRYKLDICNPYYQKRHLYWLFTKNANCINIYYTNSSLSDNTEILKWMLRPAVFLFHFFFKLYLTSWRFSNCKYFRLWRHLKQRCFAQTVCWNSTS